MAAAPWIVSDELWELVEPLLPRKERRLRHPGRNRLPDRQALQGILFVLHTGIAWQHLGLLRADEPVHHGRFRCSSRAKKAAAFFRICRSSSRMRTRRRSSESARPHWRAVPDVAHPVTVAAAPLNLD